MLNFPRCKNFVPLCLCGYSFSVKPLTSYTGKLTNEQASAIETALSSRGFKFRAVPYARFAGEKDKINVVFYRAANWWCRGRARRNSSSLCWSRKS